MNYKTTFVNKGNDDDLIKNATRYLDLYRSDIKNYLVDDFDEDFLPDILGLDVCYKDDEMTEFDYVRIQFAFGGPSVELRVRYDQYQNTSIEFVFLDWFCGVGFDVTHDKYFDAYVDYQAIYEYYLDEVHKDEIMEY